jgi:hypothetical protein
VEYIPNSEELVGYRVKIWPRDAFTVVGYTLIVPPGRDEMPSQFWRDVAADGRLEALQKASAVPPWLLGLGSWDPECEKRGQRYTICIEETEHTDLAQLAQRYPLYRTTIGASEWMCFEMTERKYGERFWVDNPYAMMKKLGYRFYAGGENTGLHFDAYPPEPQPAGEPTMEFWITVTKRRQRQGEPEAHG